jgi:heme/copper-type cytochrome/quinol oxidase subunit 3
LAQEHTAPVHGEHEETYTGLNHRKMLMWAFLGSDCMFFGSLIATYLVYKGKSLSAIANLVRWKDKPIALSIVQARLVGLAHFAVGYIFTYAPFVIASTTGKFS